MILIFVANYPFSCFYPTVATCFPKDYSLTESTSWESGVCFVNTNYVSNFFFLNVQCLSLNEKENVLLVVCLFEQSK